MNEGISPKKRTTIYIDPNIHHAFQKICYAEGDKVSKKLESFEARYVAVHGKGNPQLRLEPFIGDVQKKCFRCEGLFPDLQKVQFISDQVGFVCPDCQKHYEKRRLIKRLLS